MNENEFKDTAIDLLKEYGLSEDVAAAMAGMTIEIEKSNTRKKHDNED